MKASAPKFKLRFRPRELRGYLGRYDQYADEDAKDLYGLGRSPGYLTVEQLFNACRWKSKRNPQLARDNPEALVREATGFAFRATCEAVANLGAACAQRGELPDCVGNPPLLLG